MIDKKKNNMSEKKKKLLMFICFVVLCAVAFLGRQMYDNIKLAERCKRGMIPICIHGKHFSSVSVNRSANSCNRFDWYEPQTKFELCPPSENKETLEGKK